MLTLTQLMIGGSNGIVHSKYKILNGSGDSITSPGVECPFLDHMELGVQNFLLLSNCQCACLKLISAFSSEM